MISVINRTHGIVTDKEILFAIRAINRQINEDFLPYWSFGASLRLEGPTEEIFLIFYKIFGFIHLFDIVVAI